MGNIDEYSYNSTVQKSYVKNANIVSTTTTTTGSSAGGVVGNVNGSNTVVENCYVENTDVSSAMSRIPMCQVSVDMLEVSPAGLTRQ